jgi:hypothetical protein
MWHPLSAQLSINFANIGGRSVGIVRSLTQATEILHHRMYLRDSDMLKWTIYVCTPPHIINESLPGSRASPLVILPVTLS